MANSIDKTQYTKAEYKRLKAQRKAEKRRAQLLPAEITKKSTNKIAFVLGNGVSRASIDPYDLKLHGTVYGCNAIYRTFAPDYLVAVDVKMVLEINESGYQRKNTVWTNPNRAYESFTDWNYFNPNKGWSSGPTALWLASEHGYDRIYVLGFDYVGLKDGKKVNNLFAGTRNYKKSTDGATYYGNWLRQTMLTIRNFKTIEYVRVIEKIGFKPGNLKEYSNYSTMQIDKFKTLLSLP